MTNWKKIEAREEDFIDQMQTDTLKVSKFSNAGSTDNKYLSVKTEGDVIHETQISPQIVLKISYISIKKDTDYFVLAKYKKKGNSLELVEKVTFSSFEIAKIKELLKVLIGLDLGVLSSGQVSLSIPSESITVDRETERKIKTVIASPEGFKLLQSLLDSDSTSATVISQDLVNTAFRRSQLQVFENLLYKSGFVVQYKTENKITKSGNESAWQFFFEKNKWILGYGLNYVWASEISEGEKLEQTVSGGDFGSGGKIADGLMKTIAIVNSFVLLEIKTPEADLIDGNKYRTECWIPGEDLSGGVAQIQKSIYLFRKKYYEKYLHKDEDGNPLGSEIYNYAPKSYLIVGTMKQFLDQQERVNEEKLSCFELYRNGISYPEIITFDELYERAKNIVESK